MLFPFYKLTSANKHNTFFLIVLNTFFSYNHLTLFPLGEANMDAITIDGPSGVGKTAVGLGLAKKLKRRFLSLGMLFRALAWGTLRGIDFRVDAGRFRLSLESADDGTPMYLPKVDNQLLDRELFQDAALEARCAQLAMEPWVQEWIETFIQKNFTQDSLIVEGRTGGIFFPDASCKIFLTASPEERLRRAVQESQRIGMPLSDEDVRIMRRDRDLLDWTRKENPLRLSSNSIVWDSTLTEFSQTVSQLEKRILHHQGQKKLKVSVIIPVHNREDHLELTLRSMKAQTINPSEIELIVVDDGSTDASFAVAKKYGAQAIKISNRGPGAARNEGMKQATGDIILFTDSDMLYPSDFLENLRSTHALSNHLILLGSRRHLPEAVTTLSPELARLDSREKLLGYYNFDLHSLNKPWSLAYTCNFSVDASLVQDCKFDEDFTGWGLEDIDFAYRLYQGGGRFAYSRALAGYHLYHERSFSQARFLQWKSNLKRFLDKHPEESPQAFSLFEEVFNPETKGDFFATFEDFERGEPPTKDALCIDLSANDRDPIIEIQDWAFRKDCHEDLFFIGDDHKHNFEVYLPFINFDKRVHFFPKECWHKFRPQLEQRYVQAGLQWKDALA
ncbi:MAG: cytidylate kinase [Chlamydiales bacterium]|jgi:cytidylate kinase